MLDYPFLQVAIDTNSFTTWLFNQSGIVIVGFIFGLALYKGVLRTRQELDSVNETKTAYKKYLDDLVPIVTNLSVAIHAFVDSSKRDQQEFNERLERIYKQQERTNQILDLIAERRAEPRIDQSNVR